ncbi:MAG: glutathione synthase, partial [Wolbachia sp.]
MKVAFQMDENINFETDTTFVLIKEAQRRKHEVFVYAPNNLALKLNHPIALAQKVSVDDFSFISKKDVAINLNEMDIIFIRQDPPFDMR